MMKAKSLFVYCGDHWFGDAESIGLDTRKDDATNMSVLCVVFVVGWGDCVLFCVVMFEGVPYGFPPPPLLCC